MVSIVIIIQSRLLDILMTIRRTLEGIVREIERITLMCTFISHWRRFCRRRFSWRNGCWSF